MGLIFDLEKRAIDTNVSVTELLRLAIVVANKLNIKDYVDWINYELNGYIDVKEDMIPDYRYIDGVARYYNPYSGWCDIIWANQRQYDLLNRIPIREKIAVLEEFAVSKKILTRDFPVKMQRELAKQTFGIVPVIVFENQKFALGTYSIARIMSDMKDANTIIGGGDSASAVNKFNLAHKMTHVSTGGGASLEFLKGEPLPGVECINDK